MKNFYSKRQLSTTKEKERKKEKKSKNKEIQNKKQKFAVNKQ